MTSWHGRGYCISIAGTSACRHGSHVVLALKRAGMGYHVEIGQLLRLRRRFALPLYVDLESAMLVNVGGRLRSTLAQSRAHYVLDLLLIDASIVFPGSPLFDQPARHRCTDSYSSNTASPYGCGDSHAY